MISRAIGGWLQHDCLPANAKFRSPTQIEAVLDFFQDRVYGFVPGSAKSMCMDAYASYVLTLYY